MQSTRDKILSDDSFVLEEIEKLRVFYVLKQEIRYHFERAEEIDTESVAEHIYGMFMLSRYFLPLENPEDNLDRQKIDDMILYHDIDEIETGDTIGYLKTSDEKSIEIEATRKVIAQIPESLHKSVTELLEEYSLKQSPESKFVNAIDKLEPVVHLYCENGKKTAKFHKATFEQHMSIKRPVLTNFPLMSRFNEVAGAEMTRRGHFTE